MALDIGGLDGRILYETHAEILQTGDYPVDLPPWNELDEYAKLAWEESARELTAKRLDDERTP